MTNLDKEYWLPHILYEDSYGERLWASTKNLLHSYLQKWSRL